MEFYTCAESHWKAKQDNDSKGVLREEMGSRIIDPDCSQLQPPLPVSATVSGLVEKGEERNR